MHFGTETGKITGMKASTALLARQPVGLSLRAPHLADLFQRDERCTVLANDLKTVQAFVAAHGNRGKPL